MEQVFPRNLIHDPQHVLDGTLVLKCEFCETSKTPIESDMRIHLREKHVDELVKDLPLRGKGFNMEYRVGFVMDRIKQKTPKLVYDHKTAISWA
ncbi:MAG: hypothetical protein WCF23_04025 [Candidatus Nitrosopolaris sp.]